MSEIIECQVTRRGRVWVTHVPEYDVYGDGRTLRLLRTSVERGLAWVGVTTKVRITPVTPELERLRAAAAAHAAAEETAVKALAARRASLRDIADATGVPVRRVKQLLARSATAPGAQPAEASEECTCVLACAEDPKTSCSLSGQRHVHPAVPGRPGVCGPCPKHPDAPGDH
ncbi:hypothetical protein ABT246_24420 [Streptomyces sp. NPDC001553]|uniref:hypothetical protein n=1 Tax=Streptomyces sp. NPDC001553 TaxID=3154385 RepID=UPI003317D1F8